MILLSNKEGAVGKKLTLLIGTIMLTACTASEVSTKIPETGRYAPVNEEADGEVSYLNIGAKAVRNARREDAYKKMYEHCGGPYEIVREEEQEAAWPPRARQRRIWFNCVEKNSGDTGAAPHIPAAAPDR
jgi:hypothetical protein